MALALDLLGELPTKLFFLRRLPVLLRGRAGENFLPVQSLGVGRLRCILRLPMSSAADCKCLYCNEKFHPDARNRRHQQYCTKDACRKASKAARQARWLAKPENLDYFRGRANCERVRQWSLANPDDSRRKTTARPLALQDVSNPQPIKNGQLEEPCTSSPLQNVLLFQPALLVGPITVVPRVRCKMAARFDEFLEEFPLLLVQPALKTAGREVQLKRIHLGDSHPDLEWHHALQPS
jgi:hypothetical protein